MSLSKEETASLPQIRQVLLEHLDNFLKIKFPEHLFSRKTKRWNTILVRIINDTKLVINSVNQLDEMVAEVAKIEKQFGHLINTVLQEIDKDKALSRQDSKLKTLGKINQAMIGVNIALGKHVENIINTAVITNPEIQLWKDMKKIAETIKIDMSLLPPSVKDNVAGKYNVHELLMLGKSMVLLSLLKETGTEAGDKLVRRLADGLNAEHGLSIRANFTSIPDCMSVYPGGLDAFAIIDQKHFDPPQSFEQLKDIGVKRNNGSASILNLPIVLSDSNMNTMMEKHPKPDTNFFPFVSELDTVDSIAHQIMSGSISFDEKGASFYPFHLQLIHELIHVLHNAEGENLRNMPIDEHMQSLWETYEEYQTIKGGDSCEAQFVEAFGARIRSSHAADDSEVLFNPKTGIAKANNLTKLFKAKLEEQKGEIDPNRAKTQSTLRNP